MGKFLIFIVSFIYVLFLYDIPHCFNFCRYTVSLNIGESYSSHIILYQDYFSYSSFLYKFQISLSISTKALLNFDSCLIKCTDLFGVNARVPIQ